MPSPDWGREQAPLSLSFDAKPPPAAITVEHHRRAPKWLKRLVLVLVLVALGVGAWLGRDAIRDTAGDGYDWIEERFFDDSDEASADETGDEAFLRWEEENFSELDALSDETIATLEPFTKPGAANTMGPAEFREIMTTLSAQLDELVGMVDEAPRSPLRSAALEVFLKQVAGVDELLAVVDTGSESSLQRGRELLAESMVDYHRHARTYAGRSTFFRE